MNIIGITYKQFLSNTKKAFSAANISDVKRDSVIRKFLTHQLFPDQEVGENESRLHTLFDNEETPKRDITRVAVMTVTNYDSMGGLDIVDSIDSYICVDDDDVVRAKMRELFILNNTENTGFNIYDHQIIDDYIEDNSHDEDDAELIRKELSEMDEIEIENWLLEHIDIYDLLSDDFFLELINLGHTSFQIEYKDVLC